LAEKNCKKKKNIGSGHRLTVLGARKVPEKKVPAQKETTSLTIRKNGKRRQLKSRGTGDTDLGIGTKEKKEGSRQKKKHVQIGLRYPGDAPAVKIVGGTGKGQGGTGGKQTGDSPLPGHTKKVPLLGTPEANTPPP